MSSGTKSKEFDKKAEAEVPNVRKRGVAQHRIAQGGFINANQLGREMVAQEKFSPSWVVLHTKDAPGYKMELITRIREGVKKNEW